MTPPDSPRSADLDEVLAEYLQRLDRGEAIDREQFLAAHPTLAAGLRAFFEASDRVQRLHLGSGS
jgi:hypothetical protein